jgi:hypothetical protein
MVGREILAIGEAGGDRHMKRKVSEVVAVGGGDAGSTISKGSAMIGGMLSGPSRLLP